MFSLTELGGCFVSRLGGTAGWRLWGSMVTDGGLDRMWSSPSQDVSIGVSSATNSGEMVK